jgi:NADH dehydrogenase FAD-containing subunit
VTARVTVLGAGFGGLELSTLLSESLGEEAQVTLIDRSKAFVFGFSRLDVMFGHRARGCRFFLGAEADRHLSRSQR